MKFLCHERSACHRASCVVYVTGSYALTYVCHGVTCMCYMCCTPGYIHGIVNVMDTCVCYVRD